MRDKLGLFDFLRKKNEAPSKNDKRTEDGIIALYDAKKYDEVISKITELSGIQEISLEYKRTLALSYFYKNDYENALVIFSEIAQKKNDVENWFNCLTTLLSMKKMQEAKEVFDKMLKMHKGLNDKQPRELAVPFVRYFYACGLNDAGLFNEALEQLEELKKIYMELKITDDSFVYIRGVPFLSSTLELAKKVFTGLGLDFARSDYLAELKNKVDRDGESLIKEYEN
jgi:tetratricopeptide (TPR) repeat protein